MTLAAILPDGLRAIGVLALAGLAAAAFLAPSERARALTMLGALALIPGLLTTEIWDTPQIESAREAPGLAIAGAAAGLAVVAALVVLLARHPALLAPLAVGALPFRIPIESGGTTANLLVPLYVVIGAGALAWAIPRLRGDGDRPPPRANGVLEWLLGGTLVLYALQVGYSGDLSKAIEQVVFFYAPFALLFALLRELDWTRELALRCLLVLVALAVAFVGIGFVEYQSRHLLLNPKVIQSNQFESFFRVNSLFFDPNIYGRFLALAMLALAGVLLWTRGRRDVWLVAAGLAVLWGGLVLTFSQSSFAALLIGLAVLAALRWEVRRTLLVAGAVVAVGAVVVAAAPGAIRLDLSSSDSLNDATSGRADLMRGGLELFADRPLHGYGAGSFQREYRRHERASSQRATSASHTIPITVAAEQGALGLGVYLALLAVALARLFGGARRSVARAVVAAAFVALLAHTMLYAAFLEDPLSWTLLALGAALAAGPRRASRRPAVDATDAADALAGLRGRAKPAPATP